MAGWRWRRGSRRTGRAARTGTAAYRARAWPPQGGRVGSRRLAASPPSSLLVLVVGRRGVDVERDDGPLALVDEAVTRPERHDHAVAGLEGAAFVADLGNDLPADHEQHLLALRVVVAHGPALLAGLEGHHRGLALGRGLEHLE